MRLLAMAFLAAIPAVVNAAAVARIGETLYEDLNEAVNQGGEVVLLADVVGNAPLKMKWTLEPVTTTLDLAGHRLVGTNEQCSTVEIVSGSLTILDSVGTGVITRTVPKSGNGGGILNKGTLTLLSGTIKDCEATGTGGGVINYGKFSLVGGKISGCKANYGGGVSNNGSVNDVPGTLEMSGGLIDLCSATSRGGGIYNTFTLKTTGGEIKGCTATGGAALDVDGGTADIGGGRFGGGLHRGSRGKIRIAEGLFCDAAVASSAFMSWVSTESETVANDDPSTSLAYPWRVRPIPKPPMGNRGFVLILK